MADQQSLVRKIADDAEDVVWSRVKRYSWAVGVVLFLLGLYGFSSIQEAKTTIANEAHARLDPVIEATEARVKTAQGQIGEAGQKIAVVQKQLDDTSKLADEQNQRITAQGGEIHSKLDDVQKAANRANALSSGYEKQATEFEKELVAMRSRAEEQSRKLDETQKTFDARIAQVTQQIDNASIRQVYPSLGQKLYVTFNGRPWKGTAEKKPSDRWVDIILDPLAIGESRVSEEQLKSLAGALEKAEYTPYFGSFGVGGPVGTGYGSLANGPTGVVYFDPKRVKDASELLKLAGDTLHLPGMTLQFVDSKTVSESMERVVIQDSGIDFQIYVGRTGH
jgi:hypothetical protein